jgi:hypothetical protein
MLPGRRLRTSSGQDRFAQDRARSESLIAEDFVFTSPQDDHIDKATNRIAMAPKRWPVRRGTHRYVMRRLPYTIAYLTDGATVKIVAVVGGLQISL